MSEEYEKEFCVLLKSFREKRLERRRWGMKWDQGAVAKRIGVSRVTYNQWENGIAYPTRYHLKKIVSSFYLDEQEEAALYRAAAQVPPQIHNLPFDQNPLFTGREAHLEQLGQLLKENDSVAITQPVSISGLGGIGKTQLALEYAHRCYQKELYRTVLWVNAADESLQASYAKLAEKLDLPEKDEQELAKCVQAVKDWLEKHTHWLLIMDNADNAQLAHSFFPIVDKAKPHHGRILLTTRSQIIGRIARKIDIDKMEPAEGLLFLLRRSKKLEEDATPDTVYTDVSEPAKQLVELLDGHPLALDQAGAYIEDDLFVSFSDYINLYHEKRNKLLSERGSLDEENDGKYSEHPESVVVTFRLCFEKAHKRHPLATDILRFCAFLQPDSIPEELFRHDDGFKADAMAFKKGIAALYRYSLVTYNMYVKTLSMHRLVQAVLINDMLPEIQKQWRERVVQALNAAFPEDVGVMGWEQFERFLPLVKFCATWTEDELTPIPGAAILFHRTSIPLLEHEFAFSEAETLLARAIPIYKRHVGVADPFTLKALQKLADIYHWRGKNGKAEHLYRQIVIIWERIEDTEHLETARSLHNLLAFYLDIGKRDLAESILASVLSLQEPNLEPHPVSEYDETTQSLHKLIFSYLTEHSLESFKVDYGDASPYDLIEQLIELMLSVQKKYLGVDHPETARSLRLLAHLHADVDYEQAAALYRQALTGFEKHLDAGDLDTAITIISLADLLHDHGRHEEADALYQRALHSQEQQFEATDPFVKDVKKMYARFLRSLGRDAEAAVLEVDDEPSIYEL